MNIISLAPQIPNGTSTIEVATVILSAVTEEIPERRYSIGNDAYALIDVRKNNNDEDFEKIMVGNLSR